MKLKMISNRGTKVYPSGGAITDCVDQWFCRFVPKEENKQEVSDQEIMDLVRRLVGRTDGCTLRNCKSLIML